MLNRESSGYEAGDACSTVNLLPHSSDCTKFYQCEHNIFVEKICPSDLHFNPDFQQCNWPAVVNCQLTNEQSTKETTPETTTIEIPTEQATDETTLAEITDWLTVCTEEEISVAPTQTSTTQFFAGTIQPSSSEIPTETLTDTTEYITSEFITESTYYNTAESSATNIATATPQPTTTAEPFDGKNIAFI